MPGIEQTSVILLGTLLLVLAGCSDKGSKSAVTSGTSGRAAVQTAVQKTKSAALATNKVSLVEALSGVTSNEFAHAKACFDALDNGRNAFAMRHARELMDSTNVEVRLLAIEAFGWIGRFAVNDLAEMMADADELVSSEAQRRWELAFDEIPSESGKMQAIEKAVMFLKKQDTLDVVLMKLAEIECYNAVLVLSDIIASTNVSPVAVEVARTEYVSLAGEPFVDARRAAKVAKTLKDRAEGIVPEPPKEQALKTQQGKEKHEHVH